MLKHTYYATVSAPFSSALDAVDFARAAAHRSSAATVMVHENHNLIRKVAWTCDHGAPQVGVDAVHEPQVADYLIHLDDRVADAVRSYRFSARPPLVRGANGELYPCKPDIFWMTYEPAE